VRLTFLALFTSIVFAVGLSHLSARGQANDDLPDGEGKKILVASCTACHDLTEVTKFRGYYTRDEWRDIVRTMIEYGAKVQDNQVDVLVDYLAKTLGKPSEERR
jgi:competence protein ComEA